MSKVLKVGETVMYDPRFADREPTPAKVIKIEKDVKGKYGTPVDEIPWEEVDGNVIVDLDNKHWAWGYQISPMP